MIHSPFNITITSPRIDFCELIAGKFGESRQIDTSHLPSRIVITGPTALMHADRRIATRERFCSFDETDHWAFQLGLCWWVNLQFKCGDKAKLSRFWPDAEADMICEESNWKFAPMNMSFTTTLVFRGVVRYHQ